jgi:hypothetical protein
MYSWLYYPVSWQGIVLIILIAAFCIQVFLAVDHHSHSVSDTLYGIFPYVVPGLLVLNWIASTRKLARGHSEINLCIQFSGTIEDDRAELLTTEIADSEQVRSSEHGPMQIGNEQVRVCQGCVPQVCS